MRFNNKKETRVVPSIYLILIAILVTNIFAALEISYDGIPYDYSSLLPIPIACILAIYIFSVARYFEFDSDGETLNFRSDGLLVSKFASYRQQITEVPKSKLVEFRVENYYFFKRLHIFISSRNQRGFRHYTYHITFLRLTKCKGLRQSLEKVVVLNKARA